MLRRSGCVWSMRASILYVPNVVVMGIMLEIALINF